MSLNNTKLFLKAKESTDKYKIAQQDEQNTLNEYNSFISDSSRSTINSYNQYTIEENKIGTWIDGKTIYRKIIIRNSLPANSEILITNVNEIINSYGKQLYDNYCYYQFPYSDGNADVRWELYPNEHSLKAQIYNGALGHCTQICWIFEFTKYSE